MSPELAPWIVFLGSFLLGSIPFGLWIARAFHRGDIRSAGSGNFGATNVSRVAGLWPAGVITFALDLLKGLVPVAVVAHVQPGWPAWAAGFFAVLGHCYTPWLRFKGGKGVSTSFGVFLVLSPYAALAGIGIFAAFFAYSRIASLSSIAGICAAAALHLVFYPAGTMVVPLLAIAFLVLIRHESNLDALLQGRERTFEKRA